MMIQFLKKWLIPVLTPSAFATFITYLVVWIYLSRLGRLDIFHAALTFKSMISVVIISAGLAITMILVVFFATSLFMALTIPVDNEHMHDYDKIKEWIIKAMLFSGLFPLSFMMLMMFLTSKANINSQAFPYISIVTLSVIIYIAMRIKLGKSIREQLEIKTAKVRRLHTQKLYILIPCMISFIAHSQVIPVNMISSHIKYPDMFSEREKIAVFYCISFFIYFFTLMPGTVFLRMKKKESVLKKVVTPFAVASLILVFISIYFTMIPVVFVHAVMKISGISDFSKHYYLIDKDKFPAKLFERSLWETATVDDTKYIKIKAALFFSFGQLHLMCPSGIIEAYKQSWDFMPGSSSFDDAVKKKFQTLGSYCFTPETKDYMQWDAPLPYERGK
ncbi:hypothetical protein SMY46_003891 [Cronobacter turicensis]|nr:hypothetical protein [Cronobacter turicensis]